MDKEIYMVEGIRPSDSLYNLRIFGLHKNGSEEGSKGKAPVQGHIAQK